MALAISTNGIIFIVMDQYTVYLLSILGADSSAHFWCSLVGLPTVGLVFISLQTSFWSNFSVGAKKQSYLLTGPKVLYFQLFSSTAVKRTGSVLFCSTWSSICMRQIQTCCLKLFTVV